MHPVGHFDRTACQLNHIRDRAFFVSTPLWQVLANNFHLDQISGQLDNLHNECYISN